MTKISLYHKKFSTTHYYIFFFTIIITHKNNNNIYDISHIKNQMKSNWLAMIKMYSLKSRMKMVEINISMVFMIRSF